jgi:mono/diheme cytochrome c family protein
VIPPEQIAASAAGRIPRPDPARLSDPSQAELVERGRYLFAVASCALCHGADGAGGAKLSWRPLGTVWARNLTSDRETGLGTWTDEEIARAIRSGLAKGGRPLHWQAMTWDHASNWDEEDVRALTAFLRLLPPVRRAIPSTRPPAADDCEVYTFWVDAARRPVATDDSPPRASRFCGAARAYPRCAGTCAHGGQRPAADPCTAVERAGDRQERSSPDRPDTGVRTLALRSAIIGARNVGRALGVAWANRGHEVFFGGA